MESAEPSRQVDNRAVAVNARELLASLVGATIHTVTGRPVTILDLGGGEVTVTTGSSPEGTSLPVEWVQDALDRLSSAADVEINVDSVGRRSHLLAAVLLTLAGGHDPRIADEDGAAAVRPLPGNGRPLTVDPAVADRRRRRRRHRRKLRRRAIAVVVVVAISASMGAAIVASTTEGDPGGATDAAPEATAGSTMKRRGRVGATEAAPEATSRSTKERRRVGVTEAAPEASATATTKRGRVGAPDAPEASARSTTKRNRVRATEAAPEASAKSTTEGSGVRPTDAAPGRVAAAAPDARAGKRVFATACKKCHTLTPGDWAHDKVSLADLQPSYWTTREKVTNGGAAMPAFKAKLSEREIRNVAAFVAKVAARKAARTGRARTGRARR